MNWEYKVIATDALYQHDDDRAADVMNNLGKDGWELVTVRNMKTYDYFVFKRMVLVKVSSEFTVNLCENIKSWQPLLDAMQAEGL